MFASKTITRLALLTLTLGVLTGCHGLPQHNNGFLAGHRTDCDAAFCDSADCNDSACDSGTCDGLACDCAGTCGDVGCDSCDSFHPTTSRQLVRGRRIKWLDDTGSFLGFANKIALWDSRADNHKISADTEREILTYLRQNNLNTTLVRSNQYDPMGELKRLIANKRMSAPWKYTFGAYDLMKYTFIPGRLLGGDWYNPFTDSIHIYSDIPSIGLAKAAYAKDVHGRTRPGLYASAQDTPILGLWHEQLANKEVMRYLNRRGSAADIAEAQRILYPDFGGAVGAQVLGFLPYGNVYGRATGALAGHAYRGITNGGFSQGSVRQAASGGTLHR
ncbi:MAG: hypothetical protein AAFU85_09850 [Planctomycetota bacterium]